MYLGVCKSMQIQGADMAFTQMTNISQKCFILLGFFLRFGQGIGEQKHDSDDTSPTLCHGGAPW